MHKINNSSKKFYFKELEKLIWDQKPKIILKRNKNNHYSWFPDGKLNLYENCISRNIIKNKHKTAIITIDQNKKINKYSFLQIDKKVNKITNYLKKIIGTKKLKIMIHASASLESTLLMLSSAKLGLHFSVIFEELESSGIKSRIKLFKPNLFFSRLSLNNFKKKMGFKSHNKVKFIYREQLEKIINSKKNPKKIENKIVNSNNNLFTLFTSGSTGIPKGVTHSTGGYLLYAKSTCHKQFGMNKNSIVLAASDAGWINGHTYSLFGPLSLGSTTILIEKPVSLVDIKLFKKILSLKTNIIYLPVTLIRLIKSLNQNFKVNKNYIKALGSMGEPLAPTVAEWFSKKFLKKNNAIVNTYFQTETGGIICSPKYDQHINQTPHGSVGRPFSKYIKINKLKNKTTKEIKILSPWPGMMKNVINGKIEWNKYWDKDGNFRLFDLATTKKNNVYIHGRNDDVVNIRGHRIGSEEIESILLKLKKITECCAVALEDKLEGSKIYLFVVSNVNLDVNIEKIIIANFGTYALPKKIFYVKQLPKTRSGKILRRLLRNILADPNLNDYGDTSTILNLGCLDEIKKIIR